MKEMVGGCCVCSDERGWDENPLVYCDGQGCNVAVHQACYGIVSVPAGPWYCRKCESQERTARVHCELCPSRDGALKKTDTNGWAHVVCALYIPEVRFGNVTTMEPIQISLIPPDRFNKACYICEESNKDQKKVMSGACMTCNKAGCKQSFHVTCAQFLGLLCEEAGNQMDNVKYCGYCRLHYSKLKKTNNMKIIPPYKPVPNLNESPASSPEKGNQKGHTPVAQGDGGMSNISSSSSANSNCSSGGKKLGSSGIASNGKLNHVGSSNQSSSNSNQHSPVSRVPLQPSNLFSSGAFSASLGNGSSKIDDAPKIEKLKLKMHPEDNQSNNSKGINEDGSFNIKSELHGKPNGSFSLKNKDFSNISVTDVVAATLDRPLTSSGSGGSTNSSKFDISPTNLNSGGESMSHNNNPTSNPNSGSSSNSSGSNRPIDKPPPDIKPHVTLTPIPPIRSSASSTASVDERERHDSRSSTSKSPAHHFPSSFGQSSSKVQSQISPDIIRDSRNDMDFDDKSPNKRSRVSGDFDSDTDSASETWQERQNGGDEFDSIQSHKIPQHLSRKERYILMGQQQQQQDKQSSLNKGQNMEQWNREREKVQPSKSPTVSLERMRLQDGGRDKSPLKLFGSEFTPKRGPGRPVKRNSASSRDEDSRDRKIPIKARGGRRGGGAGATTSLISRRDVVNGGTPPGHEENSLDDIHDSGSSRGGRQPVPPRKSNPLPTSSGPPKRPNYDDIPTPTLSQLKAQAAANANANANANSSEKVPTLAPHMFGNVLNTNSSMATRLVDTLSQEMEAAAGVSSETTSPQTKLVGIPFPGKSPANGPAASTPNGSTNPATVRVNSTAPPQTLEELLERQWEQGSQFLMEQAEHLDIAQLLSCLNQLKQDNRALEDHVNSLIQRKEHLSAINARLQIPLSNSGTLGASASYSNNSSGHGTPQVSSLPVSNKGLTGRGPSPQQQLQQQIQQEALMHQGRIPTHPFPGSESEKNSHVQATNQMHNHMNSHGPRRDMQPHAGAPNSGHYGYTPSGGLPVPVVTSHPSSHHPPIRRD